MLKCVPARQHILCLHHIFYPVQIIYVSEMRIHVGDGWRVYFVQRGARLIVVLAGGSKRSQTADIKRAKRLAALLD